MSSNHRLFEDRSPGGPRTAHPPSADPDPTIIGSTYPEPILDFEIDPDGVARWHPREPLSIAELIAILTDPRYPG